MCVNYCFLYRNDAFNLSSFSLATRKSTLIFCVNVAHVQELTQTFRRFGIDAKYLTAKTPAAERKVLIQSFKDGQFPVLVNCGEFYTQMGSIEPSNELISLAILTEGADVPNIDCVIVARPTRSRNLFAQMVGFFTFSTVCNLICLLDWTRDETFTQHWQERLSYHRFRRYT